MNQETLDLATLLFDLEKKVSEVLARYPGDERIDRLRDTLSQLTRAAGDHYRLLTSEEPVRVRIKEDDYHEILEKYLPILRVFSSLPKSYPTSVYELGVVCTFDEVLVHHCDAQP